MSTRGERIVVDASGARIWSKPIRKLKASQPAKFKILSAPTKEDLNRLEDAIHNHGNPYRTEYYNICKCFSAVTTFDDYIKTDMGKIQSRALRHCWDSLKWRPHESGNRVKNGNNPYPSHVKQFKDDTRKPMAEKPSRVRITLSP
jgi:hypothetical protein